VRNPYCYNTTTTAGTEGQEANCYTPAAPAKSVFQEARIAKAR
jgi:hypothetical protein